MYYLGTGSQIDNGKHFKFQFFCDIFWKLLCAPNTVLCISIITVMGPTPPGTGVMKLAISLTA